MKKILSILLALLTLLCVSACGDKQSNTTIANPMKEYTSLEEINEKVGVNLIHPPVMGVSDERFFVISDKIAEYIFKLNGYDYTFRAAKDISEDISGMYIDGKLAFENSVSSYDYNSDKEYKCSRFIVNDVQYTLAVKDNGEISIDQYLITSDELYNILVLEASDEEAVNLCGKYQDSTSQRATAQVELASYNGLFIEIDWSSSQDENDQWIIFANYENDKLTYSKDDINHSRYINSNYEVLDDYLEGYFEIKDNKLLWTGSGNNQTSSCVFELMK